MSSYLFFLGRVNNLCFAEASRVIGTLYPEANFVRILPHVALVDELSEEQAVSLQERLGGTIKIAKVVETTSPLSTEQIEEKSAEVLVNLRKPEVKSLSFGIGEFGRESLDAPNLTRIKKILKSKGISSRFIDSPRYGLSASVLLHQDVEEVVIVKANDQLVFGYTIAVQNIDDWTKRDRMKPRSDRRRGMLPPKLARILVNLAAPTKGERVLDPFCGTGTTLLEGLMVGQEVIGADIRQEAVDQSRENIEWFVSQYPGNYTWDVAMSDATKLTPELLRGTVDAIVAEGFLGPLTPLERELPNMFKGLEKLYLGAFKQWTHILKPGAVVCIALPRVEAGKKVYSLSPLIDSLEKFGYNILLSPFVYDREGTITQREIFTVQFKGLDN
ncbi:hypothetical protein C5B42_05975 [Candidatus Cerribacteria bacterium 'Amazon FNV 2010 28 9']|uniref:Ribosomal RNA large subunit methyltransferase K/L-like methyltransferase domain-containing protein n=1 Tax=Candidatus Cerribacteria bacterium 'Amazon FNV 2010 28 9' TaxID=2081795 RepID=A0A317JQX6_9BACT|nr:MAG: hypothetical protein C5B42_05975 [Candidatus Cerribacteria bacterium 'Amazon FNV 2010 28 9']